MNHMKVKKILDKCPGGPGGNVYHDAAQNTTAIMMSLNSCYQGPASVIGYRDGQWEWFGIW